MKNLKLFHLDSKTFEDLFFYSFLGIIIGGRLGYIFFYNISYYFSNPLSIIKIWEGGMSFHGAFIGCVLSIIYFVNKYKISFLKMTDLISLTAPVGICLGRVANFLNKELIGRETNFIISVRYPDEDFYRHISQIYESLLEGLLPFIIMNMIYFTYKVKTGLMTGVFLINYALVRIIIEFIREPDVHIGFIFSSFTIAQILSAPILILGLVITYQCLSNKK